MTETQLLKPGLILDERYRIIELVGKGGMAIVYRARQERLGRDVAVKVIRPDLSREPEFRKRFLLEAQNLAKLRHPHILQVVDFVATPEISYMVTEYLPGESLDFRLYQHRRHGTLPAVAEVLTVAVGLAQALGYAHQRGIIHRDIKPANVIFDADDRPVLSDFGISRLVQSDVLLTSPNAMLGTPSYVAPEHVRGERGDARADLYSLGVLLFETVTGRLPFESDSAFTLLRQHLEAPPPRPTALRPEIPVRLEQVILKALAKHPEQRYQTAADLLDELEPLLDAPSTTVAVPGTAPPIGAGNSVTTPLPAPPPPNNLPPELTSFVGRQELVAAIAAQMRDVNTRLLTLTGPGGVGKTRLSLRVASEMLDAFPDGVFVVELAAVHDAERVLLAIEQALAIPAEQPGATSAARLRGYLADRQTLLVLDNAEQVLSAGSAIAELAGAAPRTRFLITSREHLRVYGEREFPVPPLRTPSARAPLTAESAADFPALALFTARAQAARPDFQLTADNVDDVARICGRLDGLPLAIELAAARVRIFSPAAILARLGGDPGATNSFQILRGGARNRPARQQTLRGAIDWSFQLLDEAERRLFLRLSVFVGARTIAAVESVCDIDGDLDLDPLDGLASLVDKSLLRQVQGPDGEPNFVMLTTIFEYCREQLQEDPLFPRLRRQHARYYRDLAEQAEPHLLGSELGLWLDILESQNDNMVAALSWLLDDGRIEDAARLVAAIWRYWRMRGSVGAGRRLVQKVLARGDEIRDTLPYARAVLAAGHLAYLQSDFAAAQPLYEEAQACFLALGNAGLVGQVLHNLGLLAFKRGEYQLAEKRYRESMAHLRAAADRPGIAGVLNSLGNLAWLRNDFPAARQFYERSRQLWQALGNKQNTAMVANNLGAVSMTTGEYEVAQKIFEECLGIHRELHNRSGVALALSNLSEVALEQGNYPLAHRYLREALQIQRELGRKERIAILLEGFAQLETRTGEWRRAAFLFGASAALRDAIKAPRPAIVQARLDEDLQCVRTELGKVAFAAAWAQGRNLGPARAVAFALGEKEAI